MNPGPELDELIAAKVMGWRRQPNLSFISEDGLRVAHPGAVPPAMFSPSTNIAHAWEVVEHLGQRFEVRIDYTDGADVVVLITYRNENFVHTMSEIQESTAPHAICLAALAAVEVDV